MKKHFFSYALVFQILFVFLAVQAYAQQQIRLNKESNTSTVVEQSQPDYFSPTNADLENVNLEFMGPQHHPHPHGPPPGHHPMHPPEHGVWHPHPGWHAGWHWNQTWRPLWLRPGLYFAWAWGATVPVGYWECIAYDEYLRPYPEMGPDVDQAAFGALYDCASGPDFEAAGCYIPPGYCRLR